MEFWWQRNLREFTHSFYAAPTTNNSKSPGNERVEQNSRVSSRAQHDKKGIRAYLIRVILIIVDIISLRQTLESMLKLFQME
jgi:hypothetical protein